MINLIEGSAAPDFSIPSDNGENVTLASLKGKQIVLYFYPRDDTSGCTKEAIAFTDLLAEFEAQNTVVLGVSADSIAKHLKFKTKHDLKVTLLSDEQNELTTAYGVWVEKSMYGKKYMGIERATYLIDKNTKIAKIWRKVKVAGHAEAVLEEATTLKNQ